MSEKSQKPSSGAFVRNLIDTPWFLPSGHSPGAMTKRLVGADDGATKIVYALSSYAPGHCAFAHSHKTKEQVYHVLEGDGVLVIDGVRHRVGKGDFAFLPPGVEHALYNEGTTNLLLIISSGPTKD